MKRLLSVLLTSLLLLSAARFVFAGGCGKIAGMELDVMCGPRSLLVICQRFGAPADLEELARLSGHTDQGATLAGLYRAAQAKGLNVEGVKIGADELLASGLPAIVHLWGNHFVVAEGAGAAGFKVTNPPAEPITMALADFKNIYSGFALLFAAGPNAFPQTQVTGPDLRVSEYTVDLGTVNEGVKLEHTVRVSNVGTEPLVVSNLRTSCTCLTTQLAEKTIPPGGAGEIKLVYDTTRQDGPQSKELYIHSNDPVSPLAQIEINVSIRSPKLLLSTRGISFGEVRLGQGASRELFLKDPGDGSVTLKEIVSNSPLVKVSFAPVKEAQRTGYLATITLQPGAPMGEFKSMLTLYTDHYREPKLDLPVSATITGDLALSPPTLFFGFVRQGQPGRAGATLTNAGARPLQVTQVENPLDFLEIKVVPQPDGKKCQISATLKPSAPAGKIEAELVIHTNNPDQPMLKLPVRGFVQAR